MNLLQLKIKVWISTVMMIGNCRNGNQIRAIINYGEKFESHSFLRKKSKKRAYNKSEKNQVYNATSKYQKYVNSANPPCPNEKTLKYTEYYFPGSRDIFDMPIWDWFLADVKDDSDIDDLGRNIKDLKVYIDLLNLDGDVYSIDTQNLEGQIDKFTGTDIQKALSSFMLLLMKSEIDNNLANRDLILQKIFDYSFACFSVFGFSEEYMLLYFMCKKRFTNFWRRKVTFSQLTVTKDLTRIKKDFLKMNKVFSIIEGVCMEFHPPYKGTMLKHYMKFMGLSLKKRNKFIRLYYEGKDDEYLYSELLDIL